MRPRFVAALLILTLHCAAVPASALEPLVLYDRFDTALIKPAKWFGYEDNKRQSLAEAARFIVPSKLLTRRLRLMVRGYGRVDAPTGTSGGGNRLRFYNGSAVTAMRADVWVKAYKVTGIAANPDPGSVRARLVGFFFNVGTALPGDATGDVLAQIYLRRESSDTFPLNQMTVRASVVQCTNSSCSSGTVLASTDFGTATVGQKVRLSLQWDQAGNRFIVRRDALAPVSLPYTVPDANPPGIEANKRLEAEYDAPDGPGAVRSTAFIDAYFDNVYVNQSAGSPVE